MTRFATSLPRSGARWASEGARWFLFRDEAMTARFGLFQNFLPSRFALLNRQAIEKGVRDLSAICTLPGSDMNDGDLVRIPGLG